MTGANFLTDASNDNRVKRVASRGPGFFERFGFGIRTVTNKHRSYEID